MIRRHERWLWIDAYMAEHKTTSGLPGSVDVLDRDFVDDFAAATGAKLIYAPYGANWCRTLGSDLGGMYRAGYLERHRVGLEGLPWGFPKWVYSYRCRRPYAPVDPAPAPG